VTATGNAGEAENGDFMYYDNRLNLSFSFNPFTGVGQIVSDEPMAVATSDFKQDLVANLETMTSAAYRKGKVLFNVHQQGEDQGHQVIEISCHNIKLDSFWTGEWQSTWTVSGGVLSGDLKIRTHYFEMGNSQLNLDKTFDNVKVNDITSAKDVVAAIKKVEDKVSTASNLTDCLIVPTGPGRHVRGDPSQLAEAHPQSSPCHRPKVRLGQTYGPDQMNTFMF